MRYTVGMRVDELLTEAEAADLIGWSAGYLRARRTRRDKAHETGAADLAGDRDCAPAHERVRGGLRVAYKRTVVQAWVARHPEIVHRDEIRSRTLSQDEVCDLLGVSRSTLRARRSRLNAGDADAAPPHVLASQEVRYRKADVRAWARRVNWPLATSA